MTCLDLSPLPSPRNEADSHWRGAERCGFVDDEVVLALVTGRVEARDLRHAGLVLAADDLDFAGWDLAARPSDASPVEGELTVAGTKRRAMPPVLHESGLGEPYRGDHRWWLAGLAGVACTLLFLLLLLTLASRQALPDRYPPVSISPVAPVSGEASSPVAPARSGDGEAQLTLVSPARAEMPAEAERAR